MKTKILCIGDAMIGADVFAGACERLAIREKRIAAENWETDWDSLQSRRLRIEAQGPGAEPVVPQILEADPETAILLALFCPLSADAMAALPSLRLIGVCRAGTENLDVKAATERGIIAHHVLGRNAHAVSDFAVGLMLGEARNIGRAFGALKSGSWRKEFANSPSIPELRGRTVGIVGFGSIGRLVAKKLSGFDVEVLVYDPLLTDDEILACGAEPVSKADLFTRSDFISLHARLAEDSAGLVGAGEISRMKPAAYLINTARAGLVDEDALFDALAAERIAGAALDVFWREPLPPDSRWLELDNVTLTSHIAGTTADALNKSPALLVEDLNRLFLDRNPRFLLNPEVIDRPEVGKWLASLG